jgi:hypothetical protein
MTIPCVYEMAWLDPAMRDLSRAHAYMARTIFNSMLNRHSKLRESCNYLPCVVNVLTLL